MNTELKERDITRQVTDFLSWRGWRLVRNNVTKILDRKGKWTSFGETGMPDFLALYYLAGEKPGQALAMWVELKARKGRLRPQQETWHRDELLRGACVVVARDFAEFESWYWENLGWVHTQQQQQHLFRQ